MKAQTDEALRTIVETRETALLQEVGIYDYRHPLTDAVAYEKALDRLQDAIKAAARKEDGGAILATTTWEVNGSKAEGQKMVQEMSKLLHDQFLSKLSSELTPEQLAKVKDKMNSKKVFLG